MFALAVTHLIPLPRSSLEQATAPRVHKLVNVPWEPIFLMVSQALLLGVSPSKILHIWFWNGVQVSWSTFKTVKRFGNKNNKVWCSMVKIPSRSKSEYCSRCFICQLLNILVFCRTSVGVSQWLRSSCARASYRHSSSRFVKVHPWKDLSQSLCRFWS